MARLVVDKHPTVTLELTFDAATSVATCVVKWRYVDDRGTPREGYKTLTCPATLTPRLMRELAEIHADEVEKSIKSL